MNEMQMTAGAAPENAAGTSEKSLFKRAFVYEIKRNLLPLAVFTVIAAVLSVLVCLTTRLEWDNGTPNDSCLSTFTIILCVLCTVVPVMQFSYRMKMRGADLWYSLPITRKQLTLVRMLGGLVLVLAPYTLSYWLGVAMIAMRGVSFAYIWYLPNFFVSAVLAAMLFGVNAFLFTRANREGDGIVFLIAWACILPLIISLFDVRTGGQYPTGESYGRTYFELVVAMFTYSPLCMTNSGFQVLILHGTMHGGFSTAWIISAVLGALEAAGACTALFLLAERDKAENADQPSASWMGYKVLIPAYVFLGLGAFGNFFGVPSGSDAGTVVLIFVLMLVFALVAYFAYRRSFRLKWYDLVALSTSFAAGVILFFIIGAI